MENRRNWLLAILLTAIYFAVGSGVGYGFERIAPAMPGNLFDIIVAGLVTFGGFTILSRAKNWRWKWVGLGLICIAMGLAVYHTVTAKLLAQQWPEWTDGLFALLLFGLLSRIQTLAIRRK